MKKYYLVKYWNHGYKGYEQTVEYSWDDLRVDYPFVEYLPAFNHFEISYQDEERTVRIERFGS